MGKATFLSHFENKKMHVLALKKQVLSAQKVIHTVK
jgi:hypothetical protein